MADPKMGNLTIADAATGAKEPSKRALEKARKKAEAAAKKAQHKTAAAVSTSGPAAGNAPTTMFAEGWLKRVYEEKPVKPVSTRFPPEPNGYLHIGHAKAITVNFGFAEHHGGKCYLRYDDTNPETERAVYADSIRDIVSWLGFTPCEITYSSDHFDKLYELAEQLIKKDKAYVCFCSKEEVNRQRGGELHEARYGCADRDRPVEQSLADFRKMRDGHYKAKECHLRLKQGLTDPNEGNPQMWDLAAYRVVEKNEHFRTGDKWKIYPTYDFTHCIIDAFENITHSMCTTEFYLSRQSYDWLLEELDLKDRNAETRGPMQREYSRLSVTGTILSKRRILMLVNGTTVEKAGPDGTTVTETIPPAVSGWDDPRLFTLVALRRRGIPPGALRNFVHELGVTDALTTIQIGKLEWSIRKYLERTVPRLMLVLNPVLVTISGLGDDFQLDLDVPYDPKKPTGPGRKMAFTRQIYIDRSDFRETDSDDFFRLAPGKRVGLLNAPFSIRAVGFKTGPDGGVTEIEAERVDAVDGSDKPKAFIQWVSTKSEAVIARQYNRLFMSEEPNGLDWKTGGWAKDLNPDSLVEFPSARIESGIVDLVASPASVPQSPAVGSSDPATPVTDSIVRFQAVRTAYYCVDPTRVNNRLVLNQIVALKEDSGKAK